jgi:hypothetical protein
LRCLEKETFDQATRVVVPVLSGKTRDRSTGEVKTDRGYASLILEKQDTADGPQWHIVSGYDPQYSQLKATWLTRPRKTVPDSPTIILKKAVVVQIVSEDKVVSESTFLMDP